MVQDLESFYKALDKVDGLHTQYIKRFSRHPYLGFEHFNSLYDVGTTITSFRKTETKNIKEALDLLNSKQELNRLGAIQKIEKPMSEAKWTYLLISEQNLHFVNGVFPIGFSVSIESISNLNIKKRKVTYVEVEMECEISYSTNKDIPVGKTDLTFRLPKNMMNNFFVYVEAFKYLQQEIKNQNIFMVSIHKSIFDKKSEGKSISIPFQDMNYMMNVTNYIHISTGEIVMSRPSNAVIAFHIWAEKLLEMTERFLMEIEQHQDKLKNISPKDYLDTEPFQNVDSIIHHNVTNDEVLVLKGKEFIIRK